MLNLMASFSIDCQYLFVSLIPTISQKSAIKHKRVLHVKL
jgi:hypothetical protein